MATRKLTVYLFNDGIDPATEAWANGCVYLSVGANLDIADAMTPGGRGTMFNSVAGIGEAVRVELAKNGIAVRES